MNETNTTAAGTAENTARQGEGGTVTVDAAADGRDGQKQERVFTQAELAAIVQKRIADVKRKAGDIALNDRDAELSRREQELVAKEQKYQAREMLTQKNMPVEISDVISFESPEVFAAKLDALKGIMDGYVKKNQPKLELRGAVPGQVGGAMSGYSEFKSDNPTRKAFGFNT